MVRLREGRPADFEERSPIMAESAHDYHPGGQDVSAQTAAYHTFTALTKWISLALSVTILMLALWFCVGVSFMGGLVPGLIVLVLGITFLRSKPAEQT